MTDILTVRADASSCERHDGAGSSQMTDDAPQPLAYVMTRYITASVVPGLR